MNRVQRQTTAFIIYTQGEGQREVWGYCLHALGVIISPVVHCVRFDNLIRHCIAFYWLLLISISPCSSQIAQHGSLLTV